MSPAITAILIVVVMVIAFIAWNLYGSEELDEFEVWIRSHKGRWDDLVAKAAKKLGIKGD